MNEENKKKENLLGIDEKLIKEREGRDFKYNLKIDKEEILEKEKIHEGENTIIWRAKWKGTRIIFKEYILKEEMDKNKIIFQILNF
jgi:hypothetical protein